MDPTEIIAVPLPLSILGPFVGFSVFCLFLVSVPWWEVTVTWRELKRLTVHTIRMLAISILCGAHPQQHVHATILASFYMASLISLNPPVFWNNTHCDDTMKTFRLYATLLITIPFQILQILDSGIQVQRWPIPQVLGSTVGWVVGSVVGLLWTFYKDGLK
jgi:hypothetical protein